MRAFDETGEVLDRDRVSIYVAPRVSAQSTECETLTFTVGSSSFDGLQTQVTHPDQQGAASTVTLTSTSGESDAPPDAHTVRVPPGPVAWTGETSFDQDGAGPVEQAGTVQVAPCEEPEPTPETTTEPGPDPESSPDPEPVAEPGPEPRVSTSDGVTATAEPPAESVPHPTVAPDAGR